MVALNWWIAKMQKHSHSCIVFETLAAFCCTFSVKFFLFFLFSLTPLFVSLYSYNPPWCQSQKVWSHSAQSKQKRHQRSRKIALAGRFSADWELDSRVMAAREAPLSSYNFGKVSAISLRETDSSSLWLPGEEYKKSNASVLRAHEERIPAGCDRNLFWFKNSLLWPQNSREIKKLCLNIKQNVSFVIRPIVVQFPRRWVSVGWNGSHRSGNWDSFFNPGWQDQSYDQQSQRP